ncbi:Uu.00g049530.m01.CDS01 [Anthostomella pinea]|uniref:Uu.00g049530.m01.CDS01 n=1 Tax=Anthostomella pinea TaxID=933095 RepID=A0AAI8VBX2_9PEZI|nr:Uu.00g049530.m01.CDS01 [Anthostomella pinea]
MHKPWSIIAASALAARAAAPPGDEYCGSKTPAFFLAGDSTTAYDGGWGDGFLAPLISPAWGVNIGQSGATTVSYIRGGNWSDITTHLRDNADEYECYVTISFGHNDQKAENNVTFETYQTNLINFANEVKALGGTPLLTSSLTRRAIPAGADQDNNATDSLHDQRLAAIAAAAATNSTVIDLNAASLAYVDAIGKTAAWAYNWNGTDTTHLNPRGTVVFGRMVADLVVRAEPCLGRWFTPNETLSYAIWNGLAA